jgi:hypothetical protein
MDPKHELLTVTEEYKYSKTRLIRNARDQKKISELWTPPIIHIKKLATIFFLSFVMPITGLNRPNTGKEDDDDDKL